jgi:capsid protein
MHDRARLSELTAAIRARQQTGHEFIKYAWLLARHAGKGGLDGAAAEAKRFSPIAPNVERVLMAAVAAGDTTSAAWASELSAYAGLTRDWVFNVTQQTILGKLNYTRVPVDKKVIVETGAFSAGWVAAGAPIPMSKAALSTPAMLQPKKVGAIVPFTDEAFESWSPAVEANVQASISRAVRYAMDFSLLDPSVTETAARPASLTNGIAPTQSTGPSAAQALADFNAMLGSLLVSKGADPSRVLIAMAPSTALFLSQLLTTGGTFAFPDLNAATGGSVLGFPVAIAGDAAQVGSPASNFVVAIDGSKVLVADDGLITVEASTATALQFSDTPSGGPTSLVSLFQTHTRALRLVRYLNYQRASTGAVAWFAAQY